MRWVVVLLIVANAGLWWYLQGVPNDSAAPGEVAGRLPRVAELELVGESDRAPASPDESRRGPNEAQGSEHLAAESESKPEAADPEPVRYCFVAGRYDTVEEAQGAKTSLERARTPLSVEVERREQQLEPLHWVIIPPQGSQEQALSLFREVQRRGIDSYLVTEGDQKNAISLGLFESLEAAERVLAQRKSENLNAELAFFPRNQISYALVFEAAYVPDSVELEADLADFGRRFKSVEIKRCEGVATAEKSP
ncbi:MAG: hypothetical protein R3175_17640 [Marinobacter sp.]|uniref:hypothetical protein n=1 Tax=Marinobacter sp. TaxID=50741 RepID=UPI00299D0DED|nr:hypothetical protein [Marinobacter sp.]MDX1757881.1 hypothetical protein [Marinobacter sp.]